MESYEPPEQFRSIILSTVEKLLRAADSRFDEEDGWETFKTKNNVSMARKKSSATKGQRNIQIVRGKGLIRGCDAETYRNLVIDLGNRRKLWDNVFYQGKVVELVDDFTSIIWIELKTRKCVLDFHRDLLYMQHSRKLADGTFIVASRSAGVLQDNTIVPVPEGAVRATLHTSGYVIRPIKDDPLGNCEVTFMVQCDTGGPIPAALLNRISEDQPQCIHRQRTVYAEMYGGGNEQIVHLSGKKEDVYPLFESSSEEFEQPSSGYLQEEVDQIVNQGAVSRPPPKSPVLRIGSQRTADSPVSPRVHMVRQSSAPATNFPPERPLGSPRAASGFVGSSTGEEQAKSSKTLPPLPSPRATSEGAMPVPSPRGGGKRELPPSPRGNAPLPPSPRGNAPLPPSPRNNVSDPPLPPPSPLGSPRGGGSPRPPPRK